MTVTPIAPPGPDTIRRAYLALTRRRRLYSGLMLLVFALLMIAGGILTDAIGVALAAAVATYQIKFGRREPLPA